MAWGNSPNKAERFKRAQEVPRGTVLGIMTISIPVELKAWAQSEADRREIPHSWLLTEIVQIGIEAYKLMGKDEEVHEYVKTEGVQLKGPKCSVCHAPATKRDATQGWVCDDC